jgi:hypothetical protein
MSITRAWQWIEPEIETGWASCAITQNGLVRIISEPRYPSPITPADAIDLLDQACTQPHHEYWLCDASVIDTHIVDRTRIYGPRQVTDIYLLALATKHNGRFVTFDHSVSLIAARGAAVENLVML